MPPQVCWEMSECDYAAIQTTSNIANLLGLTLPGFSKEGRMHYSGDTNFAVWHLVGSQIRSYRSRYNYPQVGPRTRRMLLAMRLRLFGRTESGSGTRAGGRRSSHRRRRIRITVTHLQHTAARINRIGFGRRWPRTYTGVGHLWTRLKHTGVAVAYVYGYGDRLSIIWTAHTNRL